MAAGHPVRPTTCAILDVQTHTTGDEAQLTLAGELDLATSNRFREALDRAADEGATSVVVDLAGLTFIDSIGLQELAVAHRRQQAQGGNVVLQAPSARVRRLLHIVGFDQLFTIREPSSSARTGLGP